MNLNFSSYLFIFKIFFCGYFCSFVIECRFHGYFSVVFLQRRGGQRSLDSPLISPRVTTSSPRFNFPPSSGGSNSPHSQLSSSPRHNNPSPRSHHNTSPGACRRGGINSGKSSENHGGNDKGGAGRCGRWGVAEVGGKFLVFIALHPCFI